MANADGQAAAPGSQAPAAKQEPVAEEVTVAPKAAAPASAARPTSSGKSVPSWLRDAATGDTGVPSLEMYWADQTCSLDSSASPKLRRLHVLVACRQPSENISACGHLLCIDGGLTALQMMHLALVPIRPSHQPQPPKRPLQLRRPRISSLLCLHGWLPRLVS